MDLFEKISKLIDFTEIDNKKVKRKLEASYENIYDFIRFKEQELRGEIENVRDQIVQELSKTEAVAKKFKNEFEKEYLLELKGKLVEIRVLLEQLDEAVIKIKKDKDRWKGVAIISLVFSSLVFGFLGGFIVSKILLQNENKNSVKATVLNTDKSKKGEGKGEKSYIRLENLLQKQNRQ